MTAGKAASQAGHAFVESFLSATPEQTQAYLRHGGTKVVLTVPNLAALMAAYDFAEAAGLPRALVVEKDHVMLPHFTGDPVYTAIGIGPVEREKARPFLKRLKLMK
jgi:peptidyl-tRNA hydrolase